MKPLSSLPATRAAWRPAFLLCALGLLLASGAHADGDPDAPAPATKASAAKTAPVSAAKAAGNRVRAALQGAFKTSGQLTVVNEGKPGATAPSAEAPSPRPTASGATRQSAQYLRARAAALGEHPAAPAEAEEVVITAAPGSAHTGEAHWSYEGAEGPQVWARLNPAFKLCAYGLRQSPIAIEDSASLQGPAEALQFGYTPSTGTVVNNGHTIQVDVQGDNTLQVRGSSYQLRQFHFHAPAEEVVNGRRADMVVHLVHQNAEGQLAVVAVQLVAGEPNTLVDTVWTYMPLDTGDRVRIPAGLLNLGELLPTDQRYYQYMGSLTTPPCTEGVLWMVLKQPMTVSPAQLRLFTQLYANNARPVQPVNGRPVRDAQ
jgi:carbonic anhydrase